MPVLVLQLEKWTGWKPLTPPPLLPPPPPPLLRGSLSASSTENFASASVWLRVPMVTGLQFYHVLLDIKTFIHSFIEFYLLIKCSWFPAGRTMVNKVNVVTPYESYHAVRKNRT